MHKGILKWAILLSAITVILGAFAAHLLKKHISESSMMIFETGVRYQSYHSLALFISSFLYKEYVKKYVLMAARLFTIGIFLFSGSLYLLAWLGPTYQIIGIITPFGGLSFIVGWGMLYLSVQKTK